MVWESQPSQNPLLQDLPRLYLRRESVSTEMVGEVAPVRGVDEEHVCFVARREPAEHINRVAQIEAEDRAAGFEGCMGVWVTRHRRDCTVVIARHP